MNTHTYRRLRTLHDKHGPREFGKISQKLVALAFRIGGCDHVVERGVQGVDIDAGWGPDKYATEIKTTESDSVLFAEKDAAGLAARQRDGYHPLLGMLRLTPLSEWLFVEAAHLKTGLLTIELLRCRRHQSLNERLRPFFDTVVEKHFSATMDGAQAYLDRILRAAGVKTIVGE
jgi:hypothetical protein